MPNTEPDTADLPGVGAPSPVEAWQPYASAPSPSRNPVRFARWAAALHRETSKDNPIYRKSARLRYVRRRRRLTPFLRDLFAGLLTAAVTLILMAILTKLDRRPIRPQFWLHYGAVVGAVFLAWLCVGGILLGRRATRFIKSTDRAMAWEDLEMTPLREEHFLWAWLWSPIIERLRLFWLAVVFGILGTLLSPMALTLSSRWFSSIGILAAFVISVVLLALAALALTPGVIALTLAQTLNLGPRLYDPLAIGWSLFLLSPLLIGLSSVLAAISCLIAGLVDESAWMIISALFSFGGILMSSVGGWLLIHQLLGGFWPAILARRTVRMQTSWWRSLFGR